MARGGGAPPNANFAALSHPTASAIIAAENNAASGSGFGLTRGAGARNREPARP